MVHYQTHSRLEEHKEKYRKTDCSYSNLADLRSAVFPFLLIEVLSFLRRGVS